MRMWPTRLADLYRQTNMIKDAIQIHIEMAEQFTKKGLLKRALEEFAQVVELDPKNLKNKVKLADLYNKEGMKDRAASIYLEVAEALAIEQMHSEANQILERAKTMITTPQVFLTQSRLCVIQKDLAGAVVHLREGLAANPRSPEILEALAEVEIQAKNPGKALEALGQVPQLPEKSMALCERALREMAKAGQADEGLAALQAPRPGIRPPGHGRDRREGPAERHAELLHRRGLAPAGGDRPPERQQAGTHRRPAAGPRGSPAQGRGRAGGHRPGAAPGPGRSPTSRSPLLPRPSVSHAPAITATGTLPGYEHTEIDPVRRMQIQQLQRDAENFVRARFMDKAQEAFSKILELDPTNRDAINRIADIIKSSGKMTAVQMHYVKTAERLAGMGMREMALEMLDKAEALFPGSTRLYRRTLGLLDVAPPHRPPRPRAVPARSPLPSIEEMPRPQPSALGSSGPSPHPANPSTAISMPSSPWMRSGRARSPRARAPRRPGGSASPRGSRVRPGAPKRPGRCLPIPWT